MPDRDLDDVRKFWDSVAEDWRIQVGDDGDANRRLNSDPVLWAMLGEVAGLRVLDAGCGTGYLTRKLRERGGTATGADLSERMIEIAREHDAAGDYRVDSCGALATIDDASFDRLVANYVLMDVPDLEGTLRAFHRVLVPGGFAVVVFSHPCFPQGSATMTESGEVTYRWSFPYFERSRRTDPPWAHFRSDFIWFHRPLSDYWKAFVQAGFQVAAFEEPRLDEELGRREPESRRLRNSRTRPYSVVFKLEKAAPAG